jgi:membrane-bound lytic murein transglycosylase F
MTFSRIVCAALLAQAFACATPTAETKPEAALGAALDGGAAAAQAAGAKAEATAETAAKVAAKEPAAQAAKDVKELAAGEATISATQGQGAGALANGALAPVATDGGTDAPEASEAEKAAEKVLAASEGGGDANDDAAPEGLVSRASGRPDHPRTLEEIKASGYIRVLTRNNDTSFFIYRGHRMGFDYELGKKLAQRLGIRVDMVITQGWNDMFSALARGEGDAIAAQVTVTEERKAQVLFAQPWGRTHEVVVWKDGAPPIKTAEDLAGKEVHVRAGSTYQSTLETLNAKLTADGKAAISIKLLPDELETDTILSGVAKGEYAYTVADDTLADIHAAYYDNLVVGPAVSGDRDLAWAVRLKDTKLAREIDAVFHEMRKKPDFNILKKKYFEAERDFKKRGKDKFYASETGTLSPYDPMVLKYSEEHQFDWRLVAAQIYQESRFDPKTKSWVGAQGLFQIMPATARGLGIVDPTDPEQSIRGGLKYMLQLSKHYDDVTDPIERYRFALAAYNSGFGHVDDARKLARAAGKDAAVWKNVAYWLLKLMDKKVAAKTRFGYCRGIEPVDYVRHIDERYAGYVQLVPLRKPAPGKASNP